MSQPTPYTPTTDFSEDEADGVSGRSTVRTAAVDVEFANLATTIGQILTNLALIQRDDGDLRDELVDTFNLSPAVLSLIGSAGFTVRGLWLTATAYIVGDMVRNTTGAYVCIEAHTSGTFATDLAANKWVTIYDTGAYNAAAVAITGGTITGITGTAGFTGMNLSGLTASRAVFTDASKNLVSNAITGTGNVVMSTSPTIASPTITGTTNHTGTLVVGGSTIMANGSVSSPGEQFAASTSSGRWSIAADRIGEAISGVKVGEWNSVGLQSLGSTYTGRDATASIASGAATTIFSVATMAGAVDISAYVAGGGGAQTASATVTCDGSGGVRISANNGANLTITLSGTNVQVTQTSGANAAVGWSILRRY